MVFKTVASDITKSGEALGIFGKEWRLIVSDFKNTQGNIFSKINGAFSKTPISQSDLTALRNYNKLIRRGIDPAVAQAQALSNVSRRAREMATAANRVAISEEQLSAATTVLTAKQRIAAVTTKALSVAVNVARVALNALVNVGIGFAINGIVSFFTDLVNKQNEIIEKNKELASSYKSQVDNLDDLKNQYLEIVDSSKTMAEKEEELSRWKETLIKQYGFEEEALRRVNLERQTGIGLIEQEAYKQAKSAIAGLTDYDKAINKVFNASKEIKDTYNWIDKAVGYGNLGKNSEKILRDLGLNFSYIDRSLDVLTDAATNKFVIDAVPRAINAIDKSSVVLKFDTSNVYEQLEQVDEALAKLKTDAIVQGEDKYKDEIKYLEGTRDELQEIIDDYGETASAALKALQTINYTDFVKTTKGSLENVIDKDTFEEWKKGLMETAGSSEPLKKSLGELADSLFPQYSKSVEESTEAQKNNIPTVQSLTEAYNKLADAMEDVFSKQDKLVSLYEKIAKGEQLASSEAYELIKQFPELEEHLMRLGDGWTFDLVGVNKAFDGLNDDFDKKILDNIRENKKIIENAKAEYEIIQNNIDNFDEYYAKNGKYTSKTDFLRENGFTNEDFGTAGMQATLAEYGKMYDSERQKEYNEMLADLENQLKSCVKAQEEANNSIEKANRLQMLLSSSLSKVQFETDNYNSKIKELQSAVEKLSEGNSLSYEDMVALIKQYPQLADKTKEVSDGYKIEVDALKELIEASYKHRNARIDDEIATTKVTISEIQTRVEAYKEEAKALISSEKQAYDKYEEYYEKMRELDELLANEQIGESEYNLAFSSYQGYINDWANKKFASDEKNKEIEDELKQLELLEDTVKRLESLKGKIYNSSSSSSSSSSKSTDPLQDLINYYNTLIQAIKAAGDAEKDRLEDEKNLIQIEIDALQDEKDALKDNNDEKQRELDLIKARQNLEKARKRKVFVYEEDVGLVQKEDVSAVEEARKNLEKVELEIKTAEIDDQIEEQKKLQDKIDDLIKNLDDYVKEFTELPQKINDAISIEQAKEHFNTTEEGLLNLSSDTLSKLREDMADAVLKKEDKDNKDNPNWKKITLDDFLKQYGATVTAQQFNDNLGKYLAGSTMPYQSLLNSANSASSSIYNSSNNNITFQQTFNIYDANDPDKLERQIDDYMERFVGKIIMSSK